MKKLLVAILLAVGISGCATSKETMQAVIAAQTQMKPTIAMTCPAGGCTLEYTDPRDRNIKLPTNGWDALNNTVNTLGSVAQTAVVPVVMGNVAIQGFKQLKGSGAVSTIDSHNIDSHDIDNTHTPTVVNPVVVDTKVVNPVVVDPVVVDPVIVNPVVVNPLVVNSTSLTVGP
jgi:hypothetical protein